MLSAKLVLKDIELTIHARPELCEPSRQSFVNRWHYLFRNHVLDSAWQVDLEYRSKLGGGENSALQPNLRFGRGGAAYSLRQMFAPWLSIFRDFFKFSLLQNGQSVS